MTFSQRLYHYKAHHIAFWLIYFIFWTTVYRGFYKTLPPLLAATSIYVIFNATAFYLVIYYLVPKFLYAQRFVLFLLLTCLALLAISIAHGFSLYWLFRERKEIGDNMGMIFVGTFSSNVLITGALGASKAFVERIRSEQLRLKTELQYLKAQVNPHFLFNAINSVYFLIRKNPDHAAETLIKLSDLLRFQLYDCGEEKIPVEKELEYVRNYIDLEHIRKGAKVQVTFTASDDFSGFMIEPFLLIPFLENAFKFVSNYADKPNTIAIALDKTSDAVTAKFVNTHESLPKANVGGIGLKNVKRRLEILYPGKHNLDIVENPDTYSATLTLRLA